MADEYIRRKDAAKLLGHIFGVDVVRRLHEVPAADVVPVVRCKDCEHARDLGFQFGGLVHESWFCICTGPHPTGANDFCSHGQKREKGEIEDDS